MDPSAYKKLTQREHVLQRPDSYVGSLDLKKEQRWILTSYQNQEIKIERQEVEFCPALESIIDEILVNAADRVSLDESTDTIRVTFEAANGSITVYNNGTGITAEKHPTQKIPVPEMIFGQFLTSSNYDDTIKRTVGGKNGFGAKCTNVFSSSFSVETVRDGKRFSGTWSNNMTDYSGSKITSCKATKDYTEIRFVPDYPRFKLPGLTEAHQQLLCRRVVDLAGTLRRKCKIYLNGVRIPVGGFAAYVKLYVPDATKLVFADLGPRWQMAVAASENEEFESVSFVNNINTRLGGTHVDLVTGRITRQCLEIYRRKNAEIKITPQMLKKNVWIFLNATIENPTYASQTKAELQSSPDSFGSDPAIDEALIKKIMSKKLFDSTVEFAAFAQDKVLKKTDGKKTKTVTGIPKLEDANKAGGRESHKCILFLCEGDSAKALVMSGLSVVGRDYYGVYPLRGKPLNVREATTKQLTENEEFLAIKKILGLKQGVTYEDTKDLRYGSIAIAADQDPDGSHINGLVVNMIFYFWPSLARVPGFIKQFVTPLVRCVRGQVTQEFFSIPEYSRWTKQHAGESGWSVKYFKGLGTSTSTDAKRYFSNMPRHLIDFVHRSPADDEAIELAFDSRKADARKDWLSAADPQVFLDTAVEQVCYSDFVNRSLVHFSIYSNERAIPNVLDGLKPSQRKILYCMLKRKIYAEDKVSTIAGHVTKETAYHHGETSLHSTMVAMAQDFVGSNNINLLEPSGQFGTRAMGGKDAASPRYIFTRLMPYTGLLFPDVDLAVLKYREDDGKTIEPYVMAPIIPMALINGANGIGTGWATFVPCYKYEDVIRNILALLDGKDASMMVPFYRGFTGHTDTSKPGHFVFTGRVEKRAASYVDITELPVGTWTNDIKVHLDSMIESNLIVSFESYHNDFDVCFRVYMSPDQMAKAEAATFIKYFGSKMRRSINTSNMVMFDATGHIRRYDSPDQILREFMAFRLDIYTKRKAYIVETLEMKSREIDNVVRFILSVVSGQLEIRMAKKTELEAKLQAMNFDRKEGSFDYLLKQPLWSLTFERVEKLKADQEGIKKELDATRATGERDMWRKDLAALLQALKVDDDARARKVEESRRTAKKPAGPTVVNPKKRKPDDHPAPAAPRRKKKSTDLPQVH